MSVYAQREIDRADPVIIEPCPARLDQVLEFQFGSAILCMQAGKRVATASSMMVGAVAQSCLVSLPSGTISFGIFFHPTGLSRVFGIPMAEISLQAYDARDVGGNLLDSLHNQLAERPSFAARVLFMEDFLLRRATRVSPPTPIEDVAAFVFAAKGSARIMDIARNYGLGLRQFERRFQEQTGIQPKLYSRIARFQSALDSKLGSPKRSWLDIAHGHGYHDQMHMIRDFHDLAGDVPSKIFSSIGDMRPPCAETFTEYKR